MTICAVVLTARFQFMCAWMGLAGNHVTAGWGVKLMVVCTEFSIIKYSTSRKKNKVRRVSAQRTSGNQHHRAEPSCLETDARLRWGCYI